MEAGSVRVVSYNIRKAVGLDWRRQPLRILRVLEELDADAVILQEADRRLGKRVGALPEDELLEALGYHFADVSIRPHSHGWHGNAILLRSPLRLHSAGRIELPSAEPRGAVWAQVAHPSGFMVRLVGVHLSLLRKIRLRQYAAIGAYLRPRAEEVASVVGGDFNERTVRGPIARRFGRSFRLITPAPSFHSRRPVWSLDRFVVSRSLMPLEAGVHSSVTARLASDHLPIVIDLPVRRLQQHGAETQPASAAIDGSGLTACE